MSDAPAPAAAAAPQSEPNNQAPSDKPEGQTPQLAEAIRKHKLKIDGQEIEVDEDELKRGYQIRKASDKAFREGQAAKKQAEDFVKMLKDPAKVWDLLKDPRIGHDSRKLAEEYLASQLQDEMMPPVERELRDTKSKLKQIEDMNNKAKEQAEQARAKALEKKHTESYTKDIVTALEETGLPRTEYTVKRLAYYMHQSLKVGSALTAKEASSLVKEDYINEQKTLFSATDGETLVKLLGEDVANKVRKWDVDRLKDPERFSKGSAPQSEPREQRAKPKMGPVEFRKHMAKKFS